MNEKNMYVFCLRKYYVTVKILAVYTTLFDENENEFVPGIPMISACLLIYQLYTIQSAAFDLA